MKLTERLENAALIFLVCGAGLMASPFLLLLFGWGCWKYRRFR